MDRWSGYQCLNRYIIECRYIAGLTFQKIVEWLLRYCNRCRRFTKLFQLTTKVCGLCFNCINIFLQLHGFWWILLSDVGTKCWMDLPDIKRICYMISILSGILWNRNRRCILVFYHFEIGLVEKGCHTKSCSKSCWKKKLILFSVE